jgi:uncharacterized membrane protein YhhN
MRTSLLKISVALALLYLLTISVQGFSLVFSLNKNSVDLFAIFKVGSILLLILFVLRSKAPAPLIAGLSFSAIGDFLLAANKLGSLDEPRLFLAGLVSFLVAHLCYITLFAPNIARRKLPQFRRFSIVLVVAAFWFLLSRLWPSLGTMRLPVLLYALALSAMCITAQLSHFSSAVALGALLFFASDAMLALSHFGHHFSGSHPLIWSTYYAAQFLICTGVVSAMRDRAIASTTPA